MGGLQSAGDPCGRLADLLGLFFLWTQADLMQTQQESAVDPKIRSRFATDSPQVRCEAVDFLVSKKTKKVRQSTKRVPISSLRTFL